MSGYKHMRPPAVHPDLIFPSQPAAEQIRSKLSKKMETDGKA